MKAISWLLDNRLLVLLATVLLTAGGVAAWRGLPIDAFPDVTSTQVMVLAKAPGLAAIDVEERVSFPIEQAMRGLPRVRQVRSLSKAGLSQVVVVFEDGADTWWTRQVVFERLAAAREALPPGRDAGARPDQHRPRRDLPVHAGERAPLARWSCGRSRTGSWRRCSSPWPG